MKVKYLGALLLAATLTFFGCDDNTGTLGIGMLPGSDGISAHTTTFDVTTRSVVADSVFAKTSTGYVGRFTDPQFGYYEASFLTELNCIDDFSFPEKYDFDKKTGILTDDTVAGVRLVVFYSTWFGDSLNACRMIISSTTTSLRGISCTCPLRITFTSVSSLTAFSKSNFLLASYSKKKPMPVANKMAAMIPIVSAYSFSMMEMISENTAATNKYPPVHI